jgi:hypothetical protein
MLQAASPVGPASSRDVGADLAGARQVDMYFAGPAVLQSEPEMAVSVAGNPPRESTGTEVADTNTPQSPAAFGPAGNQLVCSVSPDGRYALGVRITSFDAAAGIARVSWTATAQVDKCAPGATDEGWRPYPYRSFTVSSYDFPFTDNAQLDLSHRFALNLYHVSPEWTPDSALLILKLVWFPVGYITERERPMNYHEVNRVLGR